MPYNLDTEVNGIVSIIKDYKNNPQNSVGHVRKWVGQFDAHDQAFIANQTRLILERGYLAKDKYDAFLKDTYNQYPADNVVFLNIQLRGESQYVMLKELNDNNPPRNVFNGSGRVWYKIHVGAIPTCEYHQHFVYLDDLSCSGNRIIEDIDFWISHYAPKFFKLDIHLLCAYTSATTLLPKAITNIARSYGKNATVSCHVSHKFYNAPQNKNSSDVFWPHQKNIILPSDPFLQNYFNQKLCVDLFWGRDGFDTETGCVFENEADRDRFEKIVYEKGLYLASLPEDPKSWLKPLGYSRENGLGFGGTVFNYRNCPNTVPLIYWWGIGDEGTDHDGPLNQWYPLFNRKVY